MTTLINPTSAPLAAEPMLPRPFIVVSKKQETPDTVTLEFEAADGGPALAFVPGQFTMIYVYGVGEVPISISGHPDHPEKLTHTVRAVGAVTNAICALEPGDTAGIRGPFGKGWPDAEGKDLLIVAGGIGLAPVRPLILSALEHRHRHFCLGLAYGSRTPSDLMYRDELDEWRDSGDMSVGVTVDRGDSEWRGEIGVVTPLVKRLRCETTETVAIICGPEVMMRIVARTLEHRGIPPENIYVSIERNMKCGIGLCGRCQFGSSFACKDGPVFAYKDVVYRLGIGAA